MPLIWWIPKLLKPNNSDLSITLSQAVQHVIYRICLWWKMFWIGSWIDENIFLFHPFLKLQEHRWLRSDGHQIPIISHLNFWWMGRPFWHPNALSYFKSKLIIVHLFSFWMQRHCKIKTWMGVKGTPPQLVWFARF